MMHRLMVAVVFLVLAAPAARAETPEEKGLRLAQEADRANAGWGSERALMTMELINAHGEKTTRRMVNESVEGTDDGDRTRVTFEWPADVKGTKVLTWTHKKGQDDQWLYLPAVKRVKRISSSNVSGSFMGSEFAFEDLGSPEVEKFTYKWLGDVKEQGVDCYQTERFPVDKNSGYKRQVVWMDKARQLPVRIDYYDRKDALLKTAIFSGFEQHGKIWRISRIEVKNVQTLKRSNLAVSERKLGVKLDASSLESASLED
jgi:hypothetical protein